MDARERHRALRQRAWYYTTLTVRPAEPRRRLVPAGAAAQDDRRRQDDQEREGHPPRRPPRPVDRPDEPAAHDRRQRRRRGRVDRRRRDVVRAAAADRAVLPRVRPTARVPYHVVGAMQDIGTAQGPSNSLSQAGIAPGDWYTVGGGEAGHVVSDPSDPNIVYAGEYLGIITRYDHRTRQARNVGAWPDNPSGHGAPATRTASSGRRRSRSRPTTRRRSTTPATCSSARATAARRGRAISPDLTRNDKTKQQWSGGPITGDNTGVEIYGTIFAIAESPREKGAHLGRHRRRPGARDAGRREDVDERDGRASPACPSGARSRRSSRRRSTPATAYVVVDAHRLDDMRPYLFKTADYGRTWTRLDAGLAQDVYLHAVREDPKREGPALRRHRARRRRLARRRRDLAAPPAQPADRGRPRPRREGRRPRRRHARALDLDPRRPHAAAGVVEGASRRRRRTSSRRGPATRWHYDGPVSSQVKGPGQNPPVGAVLHYWLKDEPKDDVVLEVLDAEGRGRPQAEQPEGRAGRLRRTIPTPAEDDAEKKALPKKAGLQRAVWDLRHEGATKIKAAKIDSGDPAEGPMVLPGTYTLRLDRGRPVAHDPGRGAPRPPRERVAGRPRGAAGPLARAA